MLVVRFAATRKYKNQAKEKQQNGDKYKVAHFCYFFLQVLFSSHSCFDTLARDNSASLQPLGSIRCQHND